MEHGDRSNDPDGAGDDPQGGASSSAKPKFPPETWSIEPGFDTVHYMNRGGGSWDTYVSIAQRKAKRDESERANS